MQGVVLTSHGEMADGLFKTSEMFFGKQEQLKACCLGKEQDPEDFEEELRKTIIDVDSGDGVIILCDMLSGTPCNCIGKIIRNDLENDKIQVICGMNLPIVLQLLSTREYQMITSYELVEAGKQGVIDLKELLNSKK